MILDLIPIHRGQFWVASPELPLRPIDQRDGDAWRWTAAWTTPDTPGPDDPRRLLRGLRNGLLISIAFWVLLIVGAASAFGQVTAQATLRGGEAELFVGNPTTGPLTVTVSLHRDATPKGGPVTLGDPVAALIAPRTFTIGPGESQIIRLRVRAPVAPGELLRLVTLFDPSAAPDSSQGVRLVFRTRLITKVVDARAGP